MNNLNIVNYYNCRFHDFLYTWMVITLFLGEFSYAFHGISYIDEVLVLSLVLFSILLNNHRYKVNKEVLFFLLFFLFYIIYSILLKTNTKKSIFVDLQQQMKPFLVYYSIAYHKIDLKRYRRVMEKVSLIIFIMTVTISISSFSTFFWKHPTNLASLSFANAVTYYYFSNRKKCNKLFFYMILSFGLLSGRSKYFGFFIFSVFIFLFLQNEIKLNIKSIFIGIICILIVLGVIWPKFNYYFIAGFSDIDKEQLARPMLYLTSLKILYDFFPFGSGLGTFGNHASRIFYSPLYYQYHLDQIWGLSKKFPFFIADTYFPQLAQFGFFGISIFILFWKSVYEKIKAKFITRNSLDDYRLGLLILLFFLVESTADTTLISNRGVYVMCLLGIITNKYI